jgi:4'-phosphopantetheinyl transferase EntD
MFAKQAQLAVAALAFAVTGSTFAHNVQADRNVFDSEVALSAPAAPAAGQVSREQVRAEFLAARAAGDVNVFDTETVAYVQPAAARVSPSRIAHAK